MLEIPQPLRDLVSEHSHGNTFLLDSHPNFPCLATPSLAPAAGLLPKWCIAVFKVNTESGAHPFLSHLRLTVTISYSRIRR